MRAMGSGCFRTRRAASICHWAADPTPPTRAGITSRVVARGTYGRECQGKAPARRDERPLGEHQISWGDEIARVEFRPAWKGISCPWRHLARLQPGQSWLDLPEPDITKQSQVYVTRELAAPIPPEAVAAIELAEAGATEAFVVENWLGLGVMNHELIGARQDHRIWELIEAYKIESGKKRGGGFPDVVAFWPNQTVSICEVKVRGKDDLNPNQIEGIRHLRSILGSRLDLRVFEWLGA